MRRARVARSSPHTRRYFTNPATKDLEAVLFSAYAEVFPGIANRKARSLSLLRIRGGISGLRCRPPACRCSSPHTRRYFQVGVLADRAADLFSAYAEVFPSAFHIGFLVFPLLRIRGGISREAGVRRGLGYSSPHTRRYFPYRVEEGTDGALFSAYAEVFPTVSS